MLTGVIGDLYGRRPAIIFSSISLLLISVSFYYCENLWQMCVARFFYGFCYGFSLPLPSSMISELVPMKYRGKALVVLNFFVTVGKLFGCILAWICLDSFTAGDWRTMMIYSSLPSSLVFIGAVLFMHESPRFLIAKGDFQKGYEVINVMIRENNPGTPEALTAEEMNQLVDWKNELFNEKHRVSVAQLFSPSLKGVTIRLWIIWLCENAQYFGQLVIMPFILGASHKSFASYFYTILGEAPSIFLSFYIVDIPSMGRKNSLSIFLTFSAIFHLCCYMVSKNYMSLLTSIARFCMKECFAMLYPLSAEAYPTNLRSMGFGWCSGIGRLGAAFVPYLMFELIDRDLYSSFLIFFIVSSVAAVCSHTLPFDTCGRQLDIRHDPDANSQEMALLQKSTL